MRNQFYRLCILGLLAFMLGIEGTAQFRVGEPGVYQFRNLFFADNPMFDGGFLQMEGNPASYKKSRLVLGARELGDRAKFNCYPKGEGYLLQVQFGDAGKTWGNVEIENTFKKEGASLFLINKNIDDENYIMHPQRFLIQEAGNRGGYFIRSLDGRYLRYDIESKKVFLTSKQPSDFIGPAKENLLFEWLLSWPSSVF